MDVANSKQDILQLLLQASNQNTIVLKTAEEKLRSLENVPGFYSVLMDVVMDQSQELTARWQAVIYFKNGIDRYWRRNAPGAINEAEKDELRIKLLYCLKEPFNQIAAQLAVLIAKVARLDYPHQWPGLLAALLESIQQQDTLDEQRGLLVLNHVIKSLSSKRLAGDRRLFQEVTSNLFNLILMVWINNTNQFVSEATQHNVNCLNTLQKAVLSLKIVRKLIVHGYKDPHLSNDVFRCVSLVFERLKFFIEMRIQHEKVSQFVINLEEYILSHMKLIMDYLDHHPFSFIPFIQQSLEFVVFKVMRCDTEGMIFDKLLIRSLNLLKGLILCVEYRNGKAPEAQHPCSLQASQIKQTFFTESVLSEICQNLVYRYFLFTKEDLGVWESDPEYFALEEKTESWKYNLRMCTEVLFVAVFHEYRKVLIPVLLDMMRKNEQLFQLTNFTDILKREAVYNAVGLTAFDLFDEVDFDQWLTNSLLKELHRREPEWYKVVRRRVIWMIGQWVAVKMSSDLRPLLYENILPFLRSEEDMVVRITAAETLKIAVDDFEFNSEQFLPYLQPSFGLLFQLLKDVSGSDTKMHVLNVLSFIIERVDCAIRPYASSLVDYLPLLWEESAGHNMLRCAILSSLQHLVEGLGVYSEDLHAFLVPVINFSTDVNQEPHVYLLENGLELWHVTLKNASTIKSDMFHLFSNILPLLEYTSESLRTCFHIIQAYLFLAPQELKQSYLPIVIEKSKELVHELRDEGIKLIIRLLESLLKVYSDGGPKLCLPILTYVLNTVIKGKELPVLMSMLLSVVSKLIIYDTDCFNMVLMRLTQELNRTSQDLFCAVLNVVFETLPLVTHTERRKTIGLALATLLTTHTNLIHDHFCGILLGIVEVVNDILRCVDSETKIDNLILTESDLVYEENEKEHSRRKKKLSLKDPVHTVDLIRYTHSQLEILKANVGIQAFDDFMATVDVETMQQLQDLLKGI